MYNTADNKIKVSEDEPEYRKRMKTGVHSRKDGWKESEELDFDARWKIEENKAGREEYLRKQREGEHIE